MKEPMLSLSELLKAIDKFYVLAQKSFSLIKTAADGDALQQAEDVWDRIQNEKFAEQFELYLDSYRDFISSLQISPQEFNNILNSSDEADQEENWCDLLDTLQRRWEHLVGSAYLKLDLEDPKWEEGMPPQEIFDAIENLRKDANTKMYTLGAKAGLSPADIDEGLASRKQGQFMAPTEKVKEEKEQEYTGRKTEKQEQYQEKYREKIRQIGKVGPETLLKQRQELQNQIDQETNTIKKEELERRLRELPDPKIFYNQLERWKKQYADITLDPVKRDAYVARNTNRKRSSRDYAKKFEELTERHDTAVSPNEKARLKLEITNLMKEVLQRKYPKLNLDDPWVKNDPKIQATLNADNIMKEYGKRKTQRGLWDKTELSKRQEAKIKAELNGLIIQFRERINNIVKDATDALNRQLAKDPVMKPYKEAVAKAKASGDAVALKAAMEAEKKFLKSDYANNFRTNHQLYKDAAAATGQLRTWRDLVNQVDESGVLNTDQVSQEVVPQIQELIETGKTLATQYARYGAASQRALDIVKFLEDKIL